MTDQDSKTALLVFVAASVVLVYLYKRSVDYMNSRWDELIDASIQEVANRVPVESRGEESEREGLADNQE
jgi:membrane protein implicated in regulation of membrane protease activity